MFQKQKAMRKNRKMNEFQHFFSEKNILVYDQGCLSNKDYFTPFALTDVLTTYSGIHNQPMIHFWQLDRAMILGMKDTRVTHLEKRTQRIKTSWLPCDTKKFRWFRCDCRQRHSECLFNLTKSKRKKN